MFERFTEGARRVVVAAQQEARELGHRPIGTEHLLLGLVLVEDGVAAAVLRRSGLTASEMRDELARRAGPAGPRAESDAEALRTIGIDIDAIREQVERAFGPGALDRPSRRRRRRGGQRRCASRVGHVPFSPRAKKVLELSLREALALRHNYIATEHILLAVLREGRGLAARILVDRQLRLDELRREVLRAVGRVA